MNRAIRRGMPPPRRGRTRPCRLVGEQDVVGALEGHEPAPGDCRGELPGGLQGRSAVVACVEHQCRHRHVACQCGDVDLREAVQEPHRVLGRCRLALELGELLPQLVRHVGNELPREQAPEARVVLPPPTPSELVPAARLRQARCSSMGAGQAALQVAAVEHEAADSGPDVRRRRRSRPGRPARYRAGRSGRRPPRR